ncbi:MAG: hypothetical protein CME62_01125 [Halobacteriovoraceae bacterium]|nr:hypothetical protein [Halobacteriovoraceae bacterium]
MNAFLPVITSFNTFLAYSYLCKFFAFLTEKDLIVQIYISTLFIMAIGVSSLILERKPQLKKRFIPIQIFLSFFYISLPFLLFSSEISLLASIPWWISSGILVFVLGSLSGIELPFYLDRDPRQERVLFLNYSGTLIASLIFVSIAYQSTSFQYFCLFMGISNLLVCSFIGLKKKLKVAVYFLAFFVALAHLYLPQVNNFSRKASFLNFRIESINDFKNLYFAVKSTPPIFHMETPYQKIDFLPKSFYSSENDDKEWGLFLNRRVQIYSDTEEIYHQTMTFLPLMYLPKRPLKVLILGGGDLGLVREFSRVPQPIAELTLVELDPAMVKLAKEGPFLNQLHNTEYKYDLIQDDAFSFLLENKQTYDLILADFPFPINFDLMKLYSQEFYLLAKKSLSEEGMLVFDYPFFTHNSRAHKEGQKIILKTLQSAGFNYQIWGQYETFVIASPKSFPRRRSIQTFSNQIQSSVISNFVNRTSQFSYTLSGVKINSIFKPIREFHIDD